MFESLTSRFSSAFSSLRSRGKITSAEIDAICAEIRQALLESDVALSVMESFIEQIREKSLAALPTMQSGTNQGQAIFEIVNASLIEILGGEARRVRFAKNPPTVIMLAGLQGAGKTTLAGKLAKFYADQGNTPLLVASDLQRPNAVTQLQVVGESIGVPVFAPEPGNGVGNPVKVAKSGIEFAKSKLYNIVIVDTAGRLGIDEELMKQVSDIRDAVNPDEILFVVDAMIGQDAVRTSQAFLDGVGFDGVVLTKLDGDARGGAALSIASITKRPIMFASTGEKLSDFDIFYPDRMASRILGMGDVATLAEQAKKAFDSDTSAKLEAKFASGEDFTLEDFLEQLQAMSKMGSMSKLLGMLPGAGAMRKQIENFDEGEIVRTKAIVQSMTPTERRDPKVLNGSRRARIAMGSGRKVSDVNNLVDRFSAAQKMMKQVRNGGMPQGMGGMGLPAMPKSSIKSAPPKKKSKSGNPAKRALEEGQ
ncbi:MAG: signal recognition particle protein [Actinobacteria bacterium]|jgi:signal recognition particle subunit SRP54|nr:signal recognition particle protein [Actinomycetota bacterium]NCW71741.1 signal recognition particle protein [Actinomycetota bacterium]NCX15937.1 signal recognition particle protein [Actinomycetota bacterium]NCX37439.1 signal recognition particle protein [Actinomycetota bacterium]NDA44945.1 signal recognition particle protein [Actinomycetota bacterium]